MLPGTDESSGIHSTATTSYPPLTDDPNARADAAMLHATSEGGEHPGGVPAS
jgi:hypothetical protein